MEHRALMPRLAVPISHCSRQLDSKQFAGRKLSHLSQGSSRLWTIPIYWRKDAEDGTGSANPNSLTESCLLALVRAGGLAAEAGYPFLSSLGVRFGRLNANSYRCAKLLLGRGGLAAEVHHPFLSCLEFASMGPLQTPIVAQRSSAPALTSSPGNRTFLGCLLGREDSNLRSRLQRPLPYRLATP